MTDRIDEFPHFQLRSESVNLYLNNTIELLAKLPSISIVDIFKSLNLL